MKNPHGQTKILATHASCFLPHVDYIYSIADGRITKRGTISEPMGRGDIFPTSMGGPDEKQDERMKDEVVDGVKPREAGEEKCMGKEGRRIVSVLQGQNEEGKAGMQDEEINVGSVVWSVYKEYLLAGNGRFLFPALLFLLLLVQGAQVMSQYWLVFWQEEQFHRPAGFYVRVLSLLSYSNPF